MNFLLKKESKHFEDNKKELSLHSQSTRTSKTQKTVW